MDTSIITHEMLESGEAVEVKVYAGRDSENFIRSFKTTNKAIVAAVNNGDFWGAYINRAGNEVWEDNFGNKTRIK